MWRPVFTNAFLKSLKKLDHRRKGQVKEAVKAYLHYLETMEKSAGLGLKRMRVKIWEIRVNISDRILFEMDDHNHIVEFLIVGNHAEIRKFLKGR